jgi:hypothetical protein
VINGVVFEICYSEKTDIKTKWCCDSLKNKLIFLPFLGLLVQWLMFLSPFADAERCYAHKQLTGWAGSCVLGLEPISGTIQM